jgi:hypothetical protein
MDSVSRSNAFTKHEQVQVLNYTLNDENTGEFSLDNDDVLTVTVHNWWLQEPM